MRLVFADTYYWIAYLNDQASRGQTWKTGNRACRARGRLRILLLSKFDPEHRDASEAL
jgi:hypothetical protein